MSSPDLTKIRNLGVIAHIDAGKTTTTDHILFYSGAKHKLGAVDSGTTTTDYDPEEQERGITIYSACIPFKWRDCVVNLIDTPGHVDFTAEVERSLRVLDGAVVVFDAQKGVEAQSETVWRQADKYQVPRLVFINKMDVVGANFGNAVDEVRTRLEGQPAPVVIPIGAGSDKDSQRPFEGVIDLLSQKAIYYDADVEGKKFREEEVPEDHRHDVAQWREFLFEVLTKNDDKDQITSLYLEGKDIPRETVQKVIREQTLARQIQPVFCGSGRNHIGVQPLMDGVCFYLPSPVERPPVVGRNPQKKDKEEKRKPDPKEPLSALVFKIVADTHGDLFYLRIYSGTLKANSRIWNPVRQVKEFASKIYHIQADPKNRDDLPIAYCGDIVGVIGPKDSITGDTLCDPNNPIVLEQIHFAESVVSMSVEPESSADKDKLLDVLARLRREDPTFTWKTDADTGQMLMNGMGILHLEVKKHRMERDFRLKVRVSKPRVSYRETIRNPRLACRGSFEKQIGADLVKASIEANVRHHRGDKPIEVKFPPALVETMSPELLAGIERTMTEQSGWLGYPVTNLGIEVTSISFNADLPAALNDMALQAAANFLVQNALKDNVSVLEPVMKSEVTTPEEYVGAVTSDMHARRAEIREMLVRGKLRVVDSIVPLAKMFDYSDKVRSLTQGRASWTMEPFEYRPVPEDVLKQMLDPDRSW